MAVPHYAYLMLKIPGPKGVITVKESFEVSDTCDKKFNRMAQTFGMTVERLITNLRHGSKERLIIMYNPT
jgi:hypothetical protein